MLMTEFENVTSVQTRDRTSRRSTVITIGGGQARVRIYTLRRKNGVLSFQCAWYELRRRKTKTFSKMEAAKLFFRYPAYYIHGTNATHTVGRAASHGCVRMKPSDVELLAKLVQEHGGESRSDGWYKRVRERDEPSTEITLPDPVPLVIR